MNDVHRLVARPIRAGCSLSVTRDVGGVSSSTAAAGELTIVDRGDLTALHRGAIGEVELGTPTISQLMTRETAGNRCVS